MDRRTFFRRGIVGGIAAAAAVREWPFRVYSFPTELSRFRFVNWYPEVVLGPGVREFSFSKRVDFWPEDLTENYEPVKLERKWFPRFHVEKIPTLYVDREHPTAVAFEKILRERLKARKA